MVGQCYISSESCQAGKGFRLILPVSLLSDNPSTDWQLTCGKLDEPENHEHQHRHALYKAWEKNSSKLKTEAIRKGDGGQRGLWENLLATKNKKGSLIAPQHEGKQTRAQKSLWLIKRSLRERSAKDKFVFFLLTEAASVILSGDVRLVFRCHL